MTATIPSTYDTRLNLPPGTSPDCAAGRCANCWNDGCGCPLCGHSGALRLPPGAVIRDCGDLRTTDALIADSRRARADLERAMEACRLARATTVDDFLADVDAADWNAVAVIR